MDFVLKLCGWYPSRVDEWNGDFVKRHAQAIATQHAVVVLYCRKDASMKTRKLDKIYKEDKGVYEHIYYYPKSRFFDKLWSQWYYVQVLKDFLPTMEEKYGQPFIVHVNILWKAAIWINHLNRKCKYPYVITENSTEYTPEGVDNFRIKDPFRKRITAKAFRNCNRLLPVSQHLGKSMVALFGEKAVTVVPNVVDTKLFYLEKESITSSTHFELVHVSTMGYQKNIAGIINVLQRLSELQLSVTVTMIGPASREVMAALSSTSALQKMIRFTGSLPYNEVAASLRKADGFFLFSRAENLPCVILEALCCGVPVVSTRVGGVEDVIDNHNGELIAAGDEDALYVALVDLIKGKKTYDRTEISEKARATFNYEAVGKRFSAVYQQVLKDEQTKK